MTKAVLFDLDGTITDTERVYQKYWLLAAKELGNNDFSSEDALYLRSMNREDASTYYEKRFPGTNVSYMEIHDLCVKWTREELSRGIALKPGVHEILSVLREMKIKSAVVTATVLSRAIPQIEQAGLKGQFDEIISAHEAKRGKPHPEPYLFACEKLGFDPTDCIAVEDSPNGVRSAAGAGCRTIMVPDLTEPDEELWGLLYARCDSLMDIEKYL